MPSEANMAVIMRTRLSILAALLLIALSGCRATDIVLFAPLTRPTPDGYEVERIREIAYYAGKGADGHRHRLDLYRPKGKRDYPVVMLVHGGTWMHGDNRCCGLYSSVGEQLASQGIGAVLPNYRLSPGVKHPEHVKDLARAFAWTKNHIAERGGDPDRIYLVGHSAGGHLVALLTTDEQFLKAEGCQTKDVKGVIGVCGVYRIPEGKTEVELGGSTDRTIAFDRLLPLRRPAAPEEAGVESPGLPIRVNVFGPAFGDDPTVRRAASPIEHVRPGLPPFLLLSAEKDFPLLPDQASEMHKALRKAGCISEQRTIERRNHNSILFNAAHREDPVARALVEFVRK